MKVRARVHIAIAAAAFGAILAPVWPGRAQTAQAPLGSPLPDLTAQELAAFNEGRADFEQADDIADGLGPVFNGRSCAECHLQGAVGGAGNDLVQTRVTRFGRLVRGRYDPMVEWGGGLIQRRSIRELDPSCPIQPEVVPPQATIMAHRITTPLFGAGLIEAIPDSEILRNADPRDLNHDGISGRPQWVANPETGRMEIGRFGWKAQHSSLHLFAGDAYLNEIGITSPMFPEENLPQGQPIPDPWYTGPTPDDDGTDVQKVTDFMRYLAPPPRQYITARAARGEKVFARIGCTGCHVPAMTTAVDHPIAALRYKRVALYSDLLLHDMGSGLADGIVQGNASGREFRTAPLWGVSRRQFLMHDGRATDLAVAIETHGGEAERAKAMFEALNRLDRESVIAFLRSL